MFETIKTSEEFEAKKHEEAALFYFSHDECNVCKVLKPKVGEMIKQRFPNVKLYYVNTKQTPEIAAQQSIFAVPTILVFFDRREFFRKSRNIGINELHDLINRPYRLMFN